MMCSARAGFVASEYSQCAIAISTERISPRKLNLVAEVVRGMEAQHALKVLGFMKQRGAPIVQKALRSAIANAAHNEGVMDATVVLKAEVGSGGMIKRYRPGSHGRARPILRRFSKIRIVLGKKVV